MNLGVVNIFTIYMYTRSSNGNLEDYIMRHVNYVSAKLKNNTRRLDMAFVVGDKYSLFYQHP